VSLSTAACLSAACPTTCSGVGSMVPPGLCMDQTGTGGGSGGGGAPSCTPGSGLAGASCFSDGDCESCTCDTQTMLCD
jgi:hypothetical protein